MKKKQPPKRGRGRPQIYNPDTVVRILLKLPPDLAAALDKRRMKAKLSRTAAIQEAVRGWVGKL